jgi:hypothetical protein
MPANDRGDREICRLCGRLYQQLRPSKTKSVGARGETEVGSKMDQACDTYDPSAIRCF